jgi:hypothetical protein
MTAFPRIGKQGFTFRDARGHKSTFGFYYYCVDFNTAADSAAAIARITLISGDVAALTNAVLVNVTGWASEQLNVAATGGTGDYQNCETKAKLTFQSVYTAPVAPQLARMSIPAPIVASVFLADKETVSPALLATLVGHLTTPDGTGGGVCTKNGQLLGTLLGGTLTRNKFQRKLTIYDKSANLDEPEE